MEYVLYVKAEDQNGRDGKRSKKLILSKCQRNFYQVSEHP